MSVFEYIKLSSDGARVRGTIDASTLSEARRRLRSAGVHIIEITSGQSQAHNKAVETSMSLDFHRIRQRDITTATWQLATLLHAGIPLVPALSALVEQLADQPLAHVFENVKNEVNEGKSLADVMEQHPKVFSEIYISMVRAGEATGTLEKVLLRLAEMSEKRNKLTNKVKSAMVYPLFMAIVGAAVVVFIFMFIIPSITKLFLEMNRALPWPTLMLIKVSNFIQDYTLFIIIFGSVLLSLIVLMFRSSAGRRLWDKYILKCPLFGNLILKISISRFSRTLAVLLASGLSIVDALSLGKRVIGNSVIAEVIEDAKAAISHGQGIAQSFRKKGIFPPIVIHMIAAGEKSGSIEEGLSNVADVFDNEVETAVKALTSLLEPVMILILGTIVGFIVLSILLPIFDINQAIA
ncbi:MAG: type II secretion system F family protein [Sedimentisphaerales bacterium]|nr:type II secretion system F family protein [Sedimentisphaerales bacterium]